MNKTELIAAAAEKAGVSKKEAEAVVTRAERIGRNPATGAEIKIAASKVPTFKAGKALKDIVG